jgi:predicted transcriptional regulator
MLSDEETAISLKLPASAVSAYDRIASALDRDRVWVMQKVLADYLAHEGAEILSEAEGLAELDRGESADLDDVLERARAIVSANEDRRRKLAG